MISYLVATLPWTLGCLALSPPNEKAIKYRKIFGGAFFATIVPLVYFFIQHKVHRVAGGTCFQIREFLDFLHVILTAHSIHHLRLLRMVAGSVRCGI